MKVLLYFLLVALTLTPLTAAAKTPRPLLIDTDLGIDDALALLYLLKNPAIQIKAITIEADGLSHCRPALSNLRALLKTSHQEEPPMACGQASPLQGKHQFPEADRKEADHMLGLEPATDFPLENAQDLLSRSLREASQPIDLLALGPLTTIAAVLAKEPALQAKIHRLYIMGGAIRVPGNIGRAEWNFYIDPLAAKKVLESGLPITLIPLDATSQVKLDQDFYQRLSAHQKSDGAKLAFKLLQKHKPLLDSGQWYFWDPLAAFIAADESIASFETLPLSLQEGTTVLDPRTGHPVRVCTQVNAAQFKQGYVFG